MNHLTTSGWCFLGWTFVVTLTFLVRCLRHDWKGIEFHIWVLAASWAWMIWLVVP